MLDRYNRPIEYLRISITDRCNLRCHYCIPQEGVELFDHKEILSFEEITKFSSDAVKIGIKKIRITGGEPLIRKNVVALIRMLKAINGLEELCMTTNGTLLDGHAQALAEAGLDRVNISLDTMDPKRFSQITRGGDIDKVLKGINAAKDAGLTPIKINCVVEASSSETDAVAVRKFADENSFNTCFIRKMDLSKGEFWPVEGASSGGDCPNCNRLRLTSRGELRPCLFSNLAFNIREIGNQEALKQAIENKPKCGQTNDNDLFCTMGG